MAAKSPNSCCDSRIISVFCCLLNVVMFLVLSGTSQVNVELAQRLSVLALVHYYARPSCQWHKRTNDQPVCSRITVHSTPIKQSYCLAENVLTRPSNEMTQYSNKEL